MIINQIKPIEGKRRLLQPSIQHSFTRSSVHARVNTDPHAFAFETRVDAPCPSLLSPSRRVASRRVAPNRTEPFVHPEGRPSYPRQRPLEEHDARVRACVKRNERARPVRPVRRRRRRWIHTTRARSFVRSFVPNQIERPDSTRPTGVAHCRPHTSSRASARIPASVQKSRSRSRSRSVAPPRRIRRLRIANAPTTCAFHGSRPVDPYIPPEGNTSLGRHAYRIRYVECTNEKVRARKRAVGAWCLARSRDREIGRSGDRGIGGSGSDSPA